MSKRGITPKEKNYSQWYLDIVERAQLAEASTVRGCMVIKPYGYAIWENIQRELDKRIKELGASNAYFPLFIPISFFSKEADHIKGFAKESAVVTHYRLKESDDGKSIVVDPEAKLEEELIIRPTSETVMYDTFSRWIKSWRDLPLKINQWANVVRWEKRTRPFLRTTEFLWQEGHTVHSSHKEAEKQVIDALNMYVRFAKEILALDTYSGRKSDSEKFAGAVDTYGVEALMQDGKALQFGTSHDLGQNFAKVFDIKYVNKKGELEYPWQTSWGVSTRMVGAVIMSHSDNLGLVLPPIIAPIKVVIVPIYSEENKEEVNRYATDVLTKLNTLIDDVELDDRDFVTPGYKYNEWEKKGVPIRIEIGQNDIEKSVVTVVRRDTGEKTEINKENLASEVSNILLEIQQNLLDRSRNLIEEHTHEVSSYKEFKEIIGSKKGFVKAYWCGSKECEDNIKYDTKATNRCFSKERKGKCVYCGKESTEEWVFAIAY
ncbi:proline--tRNA ligase [Candidatus Dojkabacteria bacterium]|uniref:Proline--tRNA ligase n=1 Tax=Candidatus Dojkabacteria bacterium TaxID=2099670 RepID=A0A847VDM0_9BACT|nr:proline--tRNA ligase [Candidatus Dojkabacteria bacterium]